MVLPDGWGTVIGEGWWCGQFRGGALAVLSCAETAVAPTEAMAGSGPNQMMHTHPYTGLLLTRTQGAHA